MQRRHQKVRGWHQELQQKNAPFIGHRCAEVYKSCGYHDAGRFEFLYEKRAVLFY